MENIKKYIKWKEKQIDDCKDHTFASLFNIIHNQEDRIFCEYTQGLETKAISYSKCAEYCQKMAAYLKSKLISDKNRFVGIYMENSIDWVGVFWGLLMIGYKPLLLNCKMPNDINQNILKIAKCSEVITNNSAQLTLDVRQILIDRKDVTETEVIKECNWADEIALCTTASSLNYKVCVFAGKNMFAQLIAAEEVISSYCPRIKEHYNARLKLLAFLPLYHIFGLIATYLWFALFGRTIVFLKDYSGQTILNTIKDFGVTHIFCVPLFWNTIANHILNEVRRSDDETKKKFAKGLKLGLKLQNFNWKTGRQLARKLFKQIVDKTFGDSVKVLISGGGYQSDSTMQLFNAIGYPLCIGYGTSEIGIICFENRNKPKHRLLGSCGKPFNMVEVKIEDSTLRVKSESTCSYLFLKDGTRVDVDGKWFDTKDIATIDNKGYIWIKGRQDDVIINETGEKINPDLIEKQINLPFVLNYVVASIDNKTSLIVQLRSKINSLDVNKIVKQIKDNVIEINNNGYAISSIYYTNDELAPKNAIKVSRKILHEQIKAGKIHLKPLSELSGSIKLSNQQINDELVCGVRDVVAQVLNVDPQTIGLDQHFILDIGISSLDYFSIVSKLEEEFDIKFEFKEKSCQSVNSFVKYILDAKKGGNHE